jgi:hypothetical protein
MTSPRSRRAIALGLSAAVWPGLGQLYLRRYLSGLGLALLNLAIFVVLILDGLEALVRALPPDGAWAWSMAGPAVAALPARTPYLLFAIVAVWMAAMADVVFRKPQAGPPLSPGGTPGT